MGRRQSAFLSGFARVVSPVRVNLCGRVACFRATHASPLRINQIWRGVVPALARKFHRWGRKRLPLMAERLCNQSVSSTDQGGSLEYTVYFKIIAISPAGQTVRNRSIRWWADQLRCRWDVAARGRPAHRPDGTGDRGAGCPDTGYKHVISNVQRETASQS